jgi:hypothetical protein
MVLFVVEREKASKQSATISEVTGQSKTQGKKVLLLIQKLLHIDSWVFSSREQKLPIYILPGIWNLRHPGKARFTFHLISLLCQLKKQQ